MVENRFWRALSLRRRLLFAAVVIVMLFCYGVSVDSWFGGLSCVLFFGLPVAFLCTFGCKTSRGIKSLIGWMWIVWWLAGIPFLVYQGQQHGHKDHSQRNHTMMIGDPPKYRNAAWMKEK